MIRVLIVDDSAVVRTTLTELLRNAADIEVVGTAGDPFVARERILALEPDVITLDLEMPRMDGLTFLGKLMRHHPIPVVVVSSLTPKHSEAAVRALALGAVEVVSKPGSARSVPTDAKQLLQAIRAAAGASSLVRGPSYSASPAIFGSAQVSIGRPEFSSRKVLAIGASTGGTRAIETVLGCLPANAPGTVIVQHMPVGFTTAFAKRLDDLSEMTVREATDGDLITAGLALIAPAGQHLMVQSNGSALVARVKDGPPVHHQRPAVDVLFDSVARVVGRNAVGVLLTGMGADGAKGLLSILEAGGQTIAQDEATCVVYGMPKEAARLGAAQFVLPLNAIASASLDAFAGEHHHHPAAR